MKRVSGARFHPGSCRWRRCKTMVQNLIEDFATLSNEYQEGIEVAEAAEDQPTSDMLTGFKADLEKHMWMLRSFLG